MKKIPTLFERVYENHKIVGIKDAITPGCEEAFLYGSATVKFDGSCCAIINGEFYKRYDCKKGKQPPEESIPCCPPDPVTGHWPHWVKVDFDNPADKWFVEAYKFSNPNRLIMKDCTYEAIGPHFQGNPYNVKNDGLVMHGNTLVYDLRDRSFDGVKRWLEVNEHEGIVFWLDGEPICKIKRSDFGFEWPVKR